MGGSLTHTTISHYRISSQLGAGGMGEVYLAHDTKLDRKVALKILPAEVAADRNRMNRFVREAKAAAALNHPNIAHVYEIGEADGVNLIAMEYIEGATLREKIHLEQTELRKLLRYLQQVAEGLAKAHSAGIIHRDLKPDNVMITRDGYAKILDFGLAKLTEHSKPQGIDTAPEEAPTAVLRQPLSTPGLVMGTVGYMSPEQAQGKPVDHRSDIFSFGCLLYEAATGHRAFESESTFDTLHKIVHAPVPPVKEANPSAPADLTRIVRRCLAKDPDDRYQSIKEAAIELRELRRELEGVAELDTTVPSSVGSTISSETTAGVTASGAPVSTAPLSSAEYLITGIEQHRLAAVIVLATLVLAGVGPVAYLHARSSEVAIESIAVLPFQNASSDPNMEYLSEGMTESLISSLSQLPKLSVKARSSVFRYKGKEMSPRTVGKELSVQTVLLGIINQRGDQLTLSLELVDAQTENVIWSEQYARKQTDLVALQNEIARDVTDKLRVKLSGADEQRLAKNFTGDAEAYQLYLKGRFYWNKRTPDDIKKSIPYFQQAIEKDRAYALAYSGLADSYALLGVYGAGPPKDSMPQAKAAAIKALALDDNLAQAHASLGQVLYNDWDFVGAEREYRRAIELNPNYATAHQWYAEDLSSLQRHEEALVEIRRALQLDPLSLIINRVYSDMLLYARRYDEAIEQCRKTIELDPNFLIAHAALGRAYEAKRMYDQAVAEYLQFPDTGGFSPQALATMKDAYARNGWRAFVEARLSDLLERSKNEYVSPFIVATWYARLSKKDEAFAWLEKAYQERNQHMTELNERTELDSLRSDPRFADLVRRVGLPQ